MYASAQHGWDLSRDEARRLQLALSSHVLLHDDLPEIRTVAGVHVTYPRTERGGVTGRAAVVVLDMPSLQPLDAHLATRAVTFPSEPLLRSFRDTPVALAALEQCQQSPDLLLVQGHGVAHPGRFGIASHLGVLLDLPTIGCSTEAPPGASVDLGADPGVWAAIHRDDGVIGAAVRTRAGHAPVYVSSGHRITIDTAVRLVLQMTRGHRLPEPLRLAASQHRRPRHRPAAP